MITVVIGQRGTGKTHFLNRIAKYDKNSVCLDLDLYIERSCQKSVAEIFQQQGEAYFRDLEKEKFVEIITRAKADVVSYYISVGGGFDCSLIPDFVHTLWLRRVSEQWGRIFTDRPRLNSAVSPIEEFHQRAKPRAEKFAQFAWEEYLMPEGLRQEDLIEKNIILNKIKGLQCGLTILPQIFRSSKVYESFLTKRLGWELKFFEVRDDLLNKEQFEKILKMLPKKQILFSLRSSKVSKSEFEEIKTKVQWIDCDQSLVDKYPMSDIAIISRHHRLDSDKLETVFAELEPFEAKGHHIKLAVVINNFAELIIAHQWFLANPKMRSFLPRSNDGCWQWYRLLMHGQMFIEFLREGEGSAPDQPTLYQYLQAKAVALTTENSLALNNGMIIQGGFAALLGQPIQHSYTPIEHGDFFAKKNMLVLAIDVAETEFLSAIPILIDLGLRAAAVTSPLKKLAFEWVREKTFEALQFSSVNTLVLNKESGSWLGTNTDLQGLEVLIEGLQEVVIAVWGGGGTLALLQKLLPNAYYFSSQLGSLRDGGKPAENFSPEYLVWAAPRADAKKVLFPPEYWKPKKIIDLNYREDSGGRDYALKCGAIYVSGEKMFYSQAEHQRLFWEKII